MKVLHLKAYHQDCLSVIKQTGNIAESSFASPPPHLSVSASRDSSTGSIPAHTEQEHLATVAAVSGLISAVNKRKRSQSIEEETDDIFKFLDEVGRVMSPASLSPPPAVDRTHAPLAALPTSPVLTDYACTLDTFPTQDLLSLEAFLNSFASTPGTGLGNNLLFPVAPLDRVTSWDCLGFQLFQLDSKYHSKHPS
ncbi:hypothetical protein BC830DRAFT_297366 [Chytriomyces sp. MP71]|nr:hypothetical protein BC830DRAFT_297366 [Chytriomyces sp. MP71]